MPPRESWRERLEWLRAFAHDREKSPDDPDDHWALRARVLDWMAAEPGKGGDEPAGLWKTVLTPLTLGATSAATDDRGRASAIRLAVQALEDLSPLEITELRLCRKVNGFGNYEPLPASSCRAGRPLILYCEMAGLRFEPSGDSYRSRLAAHVELTSIPDGKPVWKHALGTADDLCRRRRSDYFVPYRFTLPASLSPGRYELRLTQTDLVADHTTALAIPLTIHP